MKKFCARFAAPEDREFRINAALLALVVLVAACNRVEIEQVENPVQNGEPVILVDRTGRRWDVTTAITKYGFQVSDFEYGLGPYTITPLIEPPLLSPGDRYYPPDSETFLVLGASINGDARAYGKLDIVRHEVVDEFIGGVPVAVAY